jgi:hypothetical protein
MCSRIEILKAVAAIVSTASLKDRHIGVPQEN